MTDKLPSWPEIKEKYPDLAKKLQKNRHDHAALVEYLKHALGATVIEEK